MLVLACLGLCGKQTDITNVSDAIGNPERHVLKASHRGSKQQ